jgi:hypothetical protein
MPITSWDYLGGTSNPLKMLALPLKIVVALPKIFNYGGTKGQWQTLEFIMTQQQLRR